MGNRETISGFPVTEEMMRKWAAEAEAGFDIENSTKAGVRTASTWCQCLTGHVISIDHCENCDVGRPRKER